MLKFVFAVCCIILLMSSSVAGTLKKIQIPVKESNYMPPAGYVPNERVAIAIAEAVATPIYGAKEIRSQYPLRATLKDDIWTVTGTLPRGAVGGTLLVEISKRNACIRRLIHGL